MLSGEFLDQLSELHTRRGVPYTEIAREMGVSRQLLNDLKNNRKRITNRVLERAQNAFPLLLEKNPRLKRPGVYYLDDTTDAVKAPDSTPAQDEREEYRLWRQRLLREHPARVDDREIRLKIKEEEIKMAREREAAWYEWLRSVWWGRK